MEQQNQQNKIVEIFDNMMLTQPFQQQKKTIFLEDNNKYGKEIERDYNKLQDIIDNLQGKVDKIIKSQEDDFMIAYKEQMLEVQKELKAMKRKIDEEALRQKADEKKRILEEERDYFREEALRLDKLCQEQQRNIDELKFKLKITSEEKSYYEGFVIDSKKENKALKYELYYLYKQKSVEQQQHNSQKFAPISQIKQRTSTKHQIDNRPFTQEGTQLTATGIKDETTEISKRDFSSAKDNKTRKSGKQSELQSTSNEFYIKRDIQSQQQSRMKNVMQQIEEVNIKDNSKENIKELKKQLQKDKQIIQQLKVELSQQNCKRGELEQILLDCIDQMKKEISTRQQQQKLQFLNVRYSDTVLQDNELTYQQFTQTDKIQLLKKFIGSEEFLDQLYQITFNTSYQLKTSVKLSEKWKMDADEANKKFGNFKSFKYRNISSQPILQTVLIKKNEKDKVSIFNNFTDKTQELMDKLKQGKE